MLTAIVITTSVMGVIMATPLLNLIGVKDWKARGFSVGVASHGIGTAQAFQVNETAGAFFRGWHGFERTAYSFDSTFHPAVFSLTASL